MSKIIGYTTGVYDMFHIGHLNLLKRAKENCDHLVVGVTSDSLAFSLKSKAPIIPFCERREIISSLRFVDEVLEEFVDNKLLAWESIHFNRIFKGSDWEGTPKWKDYEKKFARLGVEVIYLPYTNHISSSALRKRMELTQKAND